MVKSKKAQPSTKATQKEKTVKVLGEYYCWKALQPKPYTMAFLERTADLLIEWAKTDPDALAIEGFYEYSGIPVQSYHDFKARCPRLQDAHNQALAIIGNKRNVGAMKKKLDSGSVWRMQYQFGEPYKEAMIFAAQLAKKEEAGGSGAPFNVGLPEVKAGEEYFPKALDKKDACQEDK